MLFIFVRYRLSPLFRLVCIFSKPQPALFQFVVLSIGLRTSIFTHFYWGPQKSAEHAGKVHIDENVFIGPHFVILPCVNVGKGAVIQAGTIVSHDIPPETLWALRKLCLLPGLLCRSLIIIHMMNLSTVFVRYVNNRHHINC